MTSDLDARFNELKQRIEDEIARTRSDLIETLSTGIARMRAATNETQWHDAVIEAGRKVGDDDAAIRLIGTLALLTAPVAAEVTSVPRDITSGSAPKRFARVKVAQMQLYHAEAVANGRAARNLYGTLKAQIDQAREEFRARFLSNGNTAGDELHAEIVHALANDDATLLGAEYPGPQA